LLHIEYVGVGHWTHTKLVSKLVEPS
jgi:hypothetical protein